MSCDGNAFIWAAGRGTVPRESLAAQQERAAEVVARLRREYPDSRCSLDFQNDWQLLVATILSAQCTDERVNEVTPRLFARFPRPEDLAFAPIPEVEALVRPTGFYRNKAKNIQGAAQRVVEVYGGEVPATMEELLTLPGVARKTANVLLHVYHGNPAGCGAGVVVDTHVTRVTDRLRLNGRVGERDAVRIERHLMRVVERDDWGLFTHLIIDHGRAICTGRTRPRCEACVLADLCPSAGRF